MDSSKIYLKIISGCQTGRKYLLNEGIVTIGREPDNTINFPETEKFISGYHAIIYTNSDRILIQDLQSTNGTFVNELPISETYLFPGDKIGLGRYGPRLLVTTFEEESWLNESTSKASLSLQYESTSIEFTVNSINQFNQDLHYSENIQPPLPQSDDHGNAANRIFKSIKKIIQFKNVKNKISSLLFYFKVHDKQLKYIKYTFLVITILFSITCFFFVTRNYYLKTTFESGLPIFPDSTSRDKIFNANKPDVTHYANSIDTKHYFHLTAENIDSILKRFGEKNYSIPQDMIDRVDYHIEVFSGQLKPIITRYMQRKSDYFPMICKIFREKKLPVELAYVSMLESGFNPEALSHAGARGLWQFIPETARKYGLTVNNDIDERIDPEKSTYAAAEYLTDLIGIFGGQSSLMLCLAAYNAGEGRIINILRKIDDPLRNRDFWYIYKKNYLSEETKEYIPRIIALIIISEKPRRYGFDLSDNCTIKSIEEDQEFFDIDYRVK